MRQTKDAYNKGKLKTIGTVTDESRIIVFRDDEYAIDCKSHFPEIVDACEFDRDCFIEAVHDAIKKELERQAGKQLTDEQVKKVQEKQHEEQMEVVGEMIKVQVEEEQKVNEAEEREELLQTIMNRYKTLTKEQKNAIKQKLVDNGVSKLQELPISELAVIVGCLI